MRPLIDFHSKVSNCKIAVTVGEATDSGNSGKITVVIAEGNGPNDHKIMTKDVNNLGRTLQDLEFDETPRTGKIHVVKVTLVLDSRESKSDDELIQLC